MAYLELEAAFKPILSLRRSERRRKGEGKEVFGRKKLRCRLKRRKRRDDSFQSIAWSLKLDA